MVGYLQASPTQNDPRGVHGQVRAESRTNEGIAVSSRLSHAHTTRITPTLPASPQEARRVQSAMAGKCGSDYDVPSPVSQASP